MKANELVPSKPQYSPLLRSYFLKYTAYVLRRSFHAIHIRGTAPSRLTDAQGPLVVVLNHSSWWDLLIGGWLDAQLIGGESYGVMDAVQLRRYAIFKRMGVIGVDRSSIGGASSFLREVSALLKDMNRTLWITPQGEICSSYFRPIIFQPGLAHLAAALGTFQYLHVAIQYEFCGERLPEAFVQFSVPRLMRMESLVSAKTWMRQAANDLENDLDSLQSAVRVNARQEFSTLLKGGGGTSPVYDLYRRINSRLRGEQFEPNHRDVATPHWRDRR